MLGRALARLRAALRGVPDVLRALGRLSVGRSAPRDLGAVLLTLHAAAEAIPQDQDPPQPQASDVTGTVPTAANGQKLANVAVPATERLPDAIGTNSLRSAALKGDPTAAYEVGVRYAEGKGIAANYEEAAKWYDRAA